MDYKRLEQPGDRLLKSFIIARGFVCVVDVCPMCVLQSLAQREFLSLKLSVGRQSAMPIIRSEIFGE